MSRRHAAEKRDIIPDPKFGNVVVSKFMNAIMYDGKKSVAEGIVYGALEMIEGKTKHNPLTVFQQALDQLFSRIFDHFFFAARLRQRDSRFYFEQRARHFHKVRDIVDIQFL